MKQISWILLLFFLICNNKLYAQIDHLNLDTVRKDTIITDSTLQIIEHKDHKRVSIASKSDIDDIVEYGSRDSAMMDNTNQIMHLWGGAYVKYKNYNINAHYIQLDLINNISIASAGVDNFGRPIEKVDVMGDGQRLVANKMKFNFKTKKGIIIDARIKENDLYVNGEVMKVVSGPIDSLRSDDLIYQKNAVISTCNHPDPHFGIRASKLKVVPDKVGVIGPSLLEISNVPTPVILPFGFFPLKKHKSTGLIFPNEYSFSPRWGYGLQKIGWYFPISDYLDVEVLGNIYLRGSYGISVLGNYKKNYKYNGNFEVGYSDYKEEYPGDYRLRHTRAMFIKMSHNQDQKANPLQTFGGSIDIQINNNYRSLNYNDANSVLNNILTSNVTWSRVFTGKPYSLNASMNHSQNTSSREFNITLPSINFNLQTIYPFKGKIIKNAWYEQIGVSYSARLENSLATVDSLIFHPSSINKLKQGMSQNVAMNSAYKVLKYFNISPSFNYQEVWSMNNLKKVWDPTLRIIQIPIIDPTTKDTTGYNEVTENGRLLLDTSYRFNAFRTYSAALAINTQLFGLVRFKKGPIKGIRHQIKPTASLRYSPSYQHYYEAIRLSNDSTKSPSYYTRYELSSLGIPPNAEEQFGVNLSAVNILELKTKAKKDTIDKKVKIFDNFNISTFYNFIADTLKWSPITFNATTRLLKGYSTLTITGGFDIYALNAKKQRINKTYFDQTGKWLRFTGIRPALNTGVNIEKIRQLFKNNTDSKTKIISKSTNPSVSKGDPFWDLINNFSINHQLSAVIGGLSDKKFEVTTNSISINGKLAITERWGVTIDYLGYDFNRKELVYPSLGFNRDIHCWEMGMNWQPVRGTYAFFIRVKPGSLDFLKAPYTKNRVDAQQFY